MRVLIACEESGVVREAFARHGHEAWSCDLKPTRQLIPVVFAGDLPLCDCCGEEPWCAIHESHYGECVCLVPTEDDAFYSDDGSQGARHIIGDAMEVIGRGGWDLLIGHPPCTYLCNASVHLLHRATPKSGGKGLVGKERWEAMQKAAAFFKAMWDSKVKMVCLENPVMHRYALNIIGRAPDQTIQPFEYGDPESKRTGLWLRGLPLLQKRTVQSPDLFLPTLPKPEKGFWENQTPSGNNKLGGVTASTERAKTYVGVAEAMAEQWGSL